MKLVQAMLAVVLAGTMGSAAADDPKDSYLGDLLAAGNVDIDNTIDESGTPFAFADVYSFDIGSSTAEVKVTLQFDSDDADVFDSSNFAITLRDTSGFEYASDDTFNAGALELSAVLAPSALGVPGFYEFVVSGTTAGSAGGIDDEYEYEGALSAAPVPEPKGWMLMLAGFGLVGFMMSRRRQA